MKNPNTMLLLTVIVGVLVLGVAYAAIQNVTLTVTGEVVATPDQGNFKVKFTGTPTSSGNGNATVSITGDLTATMSITGLKVVGDEMVVRYIIANESQGISADLSRTLTHTNNEYFDVTATLSETQIDTTSTATLIIKVKLIKVPITENATDSVTVNVIARPVYESFS